MQKPRTSLYALHGGLAVTSPGEDVGILIAPAVAP